MNDAADTAARPPLDGQVVQLLPAPVTVVGVAAGADRGGLTVSWITRVSRVPPLLLISVAHSRHSHGLLLRAGAFSVSILAEGQADLARHFGQQSQRDLDKWAAVPHLLLEDGTPALARCAARCLCRLRDRFPLGDHDGFVGEVVQAEMVDGGAVLPYRREDYHP